MGNKAAMLIFRLEESWKQWKKDAKKASTKRGRRKKIVAISPTTIQKGWGGYYVGEKEGAGGIQTGRSWGNADAIEAQFHVRMGSRNLMRVRGADDSIQRDQEEGG